MPENGLHSDGDGSTVKEVEVRIVDDHDSQVMSRRRIEAATEGVDLEGRQIVVEGVHYLVDGQQVVVTGKNLPQMNSD